MEVHSHFASTCNWNKYNPLATLIIWFRSGFLQKHSPKKVSQLFKTQLLMALYNLWLLSLDRLSFLQLRIVESRYSILQIELRALGNTSLLTMRHLNSRYLCEREKLMGHLKIHFYITHCLHLEQMDWLKIEYSEHKHHYAKLPEWRSICPLLSSAGDYSSWT